MDSTDPYSPSIWTPSPRRMGCAKAMITPDARFAMVVCAAKPMAMPTTPAEANMPTATLCRAETFMIQKTRPTATKNKATASSRWIMRRRVSAPASATARLRRFENRLMAWRMSQ